jgi:phospholipid/cholesterol/gamma-HCH transport system substrate-binding protein
VVGNNEDDIRQSVTELKKSLKTISSDVDSVMYNLDETSRNFNEFSRKVRANPSLLISTPAPVEQDEARR